MEEICWGVKKKGKGKDVINYYDLKIQRHKVINDKGMGVHTHLLPYILQTQSVSCHMWMLKKIYIFSRSLSKLILTRDLTGKNNQGMVYELWLLGES